MRPITALLIALPAVAAAGCFARTHVSYSEHPELAAVRLATGRPQSVPENLGMVEASASGFGSCSTIAARALSNLLAEAKAHGGTMVEDVKFRAQFHWTGHALCRRFFPLLPGVYSSDVQGVAVVTRQP